MIVRRHGGRRRLLPARRSGGWTKGARRARSRWPLVVTDNQRFWLCASFDPLRRRKGQSCRHFHLWGHEVLQPELRRERLRVPFRPPLTLLILAKEPARFRVAALRWHASYSSDTKASLEHAFATYDVQYVYADPWKWQDELEEWAARWPDCIVEWPTNSVRGMAPAVDRFRSALEEGRVTHDGDAALARHVQSARLRKAGPDEDGRGRYTLEKAGPGRLIDALVASVLAYEAAQQIGEEPPPLKPLFAFV